MTATDRSFSSHCITDGKSELIFPVELPQTKFQHFPFESARKEQVYLCFAQPSGKQGGKDIFCRYRIVAWCFLHPNSIETELTFSATFNFFLYHSLLKWIFDTLHIQGVEEGVGRLLTLRNCLRGLISVAISTTALLWSYQWFLFYKTIYIIPLSPLWDDLSNFWCPESSRHSWEMPKNALLWISRSTDTAELREQTSMGWVTPADAATTPTPTPSTQKLVLRSNWL